MKDNIKKVIHLDSVFTKDALPKSDETIDSINIEGYANTTEKDRAGDVITADAWKSGMENYLKNPIILFNHDYDEPVGSMVDHKVDSKGLWIKARISAAAEDTFNLVKDEVLKTFSVSFMIKDAIYDALTDIFVIKELELLEISVVSVPCNASSTFSLSKSFESSEDEKQFKNQFVVEMAAKGQETPESDKINKEWNMDPKELEALLAKAAEDAVKKADEARAKTEAEAKAKADAEAAIAAQVEKAVATQISLGQSGAEKLLADVEKRFADTETKTKSVLEGLEASIKEKAEELANIQKSKMTFADKETQEGVTYAEKEMAVLAGKFSKKGLAGTKYGQEIIAKAGAHTASATWETEVSLNMENEIRRKLVIAPVFRAIDMKTNVMKLPSNPEAGYATWMANSSFGTTASTGAAQTHAISEVTLSAYKVATLEYLNFEEEEDSLIALTPIIRDAMIRRVARAVDKAYLIGAGSGADPVKGVCLYDATSVVVPTNTGVSTIANLRALRKDLGVWGLNPQDFVYIVSTEVYYDLLDDTSFQSVLQVGVNTATLLTGQVGMIGSTPVLVSGEFPSKAGGAATATTNIGAIAVASGNFLAGNQRGLRMDTQDLVETQRTALVASLRTGLIQLATAAGQGVSVLRWS
jgi:HK97 family phage prohead protease/HK97 family phage major capsid protein